MSLYNVYFEDPKKMAESVFYSERPPRKTGRSVMRNLKAKSVKQLRELFKKAQKANPRRFGKLNIVKIEKVEK